MFVSETDHLTHFTPTSDVYYRDSYNRVIRGSTIRPLCGGLTEDNVTKKTWRLVYRRREWLTSLFNVGLPIGQTDKLYYDNCPPCTFRVRPLMRACKLRYCPFCWARRAGRTYSKLAMIHKGTRLGVYSWSMTDVPWLAVDESDVEGQLTDLLAGMKRQRAKIKSTMLAGSVANCYRVTIEPPAEGDMYWRLRHGAVALFPRHSPNPEPAEGLTIDDRVANRGKLVRAVCTVMRYPVRWMTGQPNRMVHMLLATQGQQFFSMSGALRGIK